MAIQFARTEIISAGKGSSALGLSAYIAREDRLAEATDQAYGFAHKDDDLEHCSVYLPEEAPVWMRDGKQLWNAAEAKEITLDRKTGEFRFKKNAQLAKHTVLALPKELNAEEQRDLLEGFISDNYTRYGVAVEAAIHSPHESGENWHAHLMVTTRTVTKDGLGKKARHLNPHFSKGRNLGDEIGQRWADHQNAYFHEKGFDLNVDPTSETPSIHLGKSRFIDNGDFKDEQTERREHHARLILKNPEIVTSKLTERKPFFTEREVSRYLFKAGFDGNDFDKTKAAVMAHGIALFDRQTGSETGKFTTEKVRNQEREIMRVADKLASQNRHRLSPQSVLRNAAMGDMSDEQQRAYLSAVDNGHDLSIWRGVAGTGKSYAMNIAREAYEDEGYQVIGLAPTNVVVRDMQRDGFKHARTAHSFLYGLEMGNLHLNKSSVLFVDEAAMLDNERLLPVLEHAHKAGAKVILIGDDRQLASIERGGMFSALRERHNSSELRQVRRQKEAWAKQASLDFADGRFEKAIEAYEQKERIQWSADTETAKAQLVKAWKQDTQEKSTKTRFVYAQTNKDVNALNEALRQVRVERGELSASHSYEVVRGQTCRTIKMSKNDRIQFFDNDRQAGIFNGYVGTIEKIEGDHMSVQLDNGSQIKFNAREFKGFGHGYAGTVYRGQGKTQLETYYLHTPLSDSRTSYVAMTRHKDNVSLFVGKKTTPNVQILAKQMGRQNDRGPSLRYATKGDLQRTQSKPQPSLKERLKTMKPPNKTYTEDHSQAQVHEKKNHPKRDNSKTTKQGHKIKGLNLNKVQPPSTDAGQRLMKQMQESRTERVNVRTKGPVLER